MAYTDGWTTRPRVQDLHAMERQPVHASPRQFTSNPAEQAIRSDRVTSVHESSPRTVTSLVTSRPPTRACRDNPSLFRVHAACVAGPLLPQPVRQAPQGPGSVQCTPADDDCTARAHATRPS